MRKTYFACIISLLGKANPNTNSFSKNSFNSKLCFLVDPAAGDGENFLPTYDTGCFLKLADKES